MVGEFDDLPCPDALPATPDGWRYEALGDLVEDRGVSCGIVQPGSEIATGREDGPHAGRIALRRLGF